jgi:uncharacterized membrane protein
MESSMRQKQEEQVRRYVMAEVIPGIQTGLSRELPSRFNEQVNNLIKEICEKFETNLQEIRSEITKAQAEKESKIFNTEEHINKYCLAKDNITTLANKIIFN